MCFLCTTPLYYVVVFSRGQRQQQQGVWENGNGQNFVGRHCGYNM